MIAVLGRSVDAQVLQRVRIHGRTFLVDGIAIAAAYLSATGMRYDGELPEAQIHALLVAVPLVIVVHTFLNYFYRIHRRIWKYANVRDARALIDASLISMLIVGSADFLIPVPGSRLLPFSVVPMGAALALLGLAVVRFWPRLRQAKLHGKADSNRILIVGAGEAGQLMAASLQANPEWGQRPIGFVDDDPGKCKMRIHGLPVLGRVDDLRGIVEHYRVDTVGIAIPSASTVEIDRILAIAQETQARLQILPGAAEIMAGKAPMRLHDISLDDLLDRSPSSAALQSPDVQASLSGRVVLVTGARGSIGLELCRQLLTLKPARVLALDNNETGLFYLERELSGEPNSERLTVVLADITDEDKLGQVFRRYRPDVIFHAAAYKHVPLLESHPEEAVFVNVHGTLNLCRMATQHRCERFVFISTDKAVEPANVLGFSKRIGELIVRSHAGSPTVFCSVRFGNVIGSRGSALPEFIHQIDAGGPVTVTHPNVERFLMTIPESVSLVIQAGAFARGGELFMLDMGKPIKIVDLVKRIIRLRGLRIGKDIEIVFTGLRPGEKMTEELVFAAERTEPTANPAIFQICDDIEPDFQALHRSVTTLLQLARLGEPEVVRGALAELACSRVAHAGDGRLHSLTAAVERAVVSSAALADNASELERRLGSDRRTGKDRRVGMGGYEGPERRKSVLDRRTRADRRHVVTALMDRFQRQGLPA